MRCFYACRAPAEMVEWLFAALSRLLDTPDPVALLEGLLSDADGTPGTAVDGFAQAAPGVAPSVPVG